MFEALKQRIFTYYLSKQPKRQVLFPHYENIRSVLILYESDYTEKNQYIRDLRNRLSQLSMDVVTWGYVEKKDIESLNLPQSRILGSRDFTPFLTPKQGTIWDLQRRQYDLLIDLTQHTCLPLHYLAMYAKADFKAAMVLPLTSGIHDFLIQMPAEDTPQHLYEQITQFLMTIHSND